jgi:hypothetical protein
VGLAVQASVSAPVGMCSLMFHTLGTEALGGPHHCRCTWVVVFDSGCSSTVGRISAFRHGTCLGRQRKQKQERRTSSCSIQSCLCDITPGIRVLSCLAPLIRRCGFFQSSKLPLSSSPFSLLNCP